MTFNFEHKEAPLPAKLAAQAGWKLDGAGNVIALPKTEEAQKKLADHGIARPTQAGSHRNWNEADIESMQKLETRLDEMLEYRPVDAVLSAAKKFMEQLEHDNRSKIGGMKKLSYNNALGHRTSECV